MISRKQFICLLIGMLLNLGSTFGKDFFEHLTIKDGLAHTDVNSICQDSTGLIWLGTNGGLQRFDGYSLKTFDFYPTDNKIFYSHNRINAMACSCDKLWLGTDNGITSFDLVTHRYTDIEMQATEEAMDANVTDLVLIPNQSLWAMTSEGLSVAIFEDNKLQLLEWEKQEEKQLTNSFGQLHIQHQNIWTYSKKHIYQLGIENHKVKIINKFSIVDLTHESSNIESIAIFQNYLYIKTNESFCKIPFSENTLNSSASIVTRSLHKVFTNNAINQFVIGKDENLWCASSIGHIVEVQHLFSTSPIVNKYLSNNNLNPNFSKLKVNSLLIDKYDNLWIATMGWGVFYRPRVLSPFYNISNKQFQEMGFSQNQIHSVTKQKDGNLWMLVERSSIFRYSLKHEELIHVNIPNIDTEPNFYQHVLMSKDQETLYIGLSNGMAMYNTKTQKVTWLLGGTSKLHDWAFSVVCIKEDRKGRLWIGTWGKGLICITDPKINPQVEYYYNTKTASSILSNFISDIFVNDDDILICSNNGLNKITLDKQTAEVQDIIKYQTQDNVATSMSSNYLVSIDCDNDSTYWIGTIGGGLNKVVMHSDKDNDYTATCYTTADGLTSNDCEIVYVDEHKNIWIGGKDIACLNSKDQTISTYSSLDGQFANYFKVGAGYKDDEGVIYMGGLFGLTFFTPAQIKHSSSIAKLAFMDLTINNILVDPLETYNNTVPLSKILNLTDKIELTHNQNNFLISFSAFGYQLSEQIKYRYRILDYNDNWQELPYTTNWISYSNFPYGKYILQLQVSNDKGLTWSKDKKELEIEILAPWWWNTWTKLCYAIIFTIIVFIIFYLYNKKQNLKKENEIQKILKTKDEERYESKMHFFMNASHELKTPLTLISLAAEHMTDKEETKKELSSIMSNTKKMQLLITEMVDIRKTDIGIGTLKLSHLNVSQLTQQLFDEVSMWAEEKNISISIDTDATDIEMDADREQIGKLVINLLSNAIKYTGQGGNIQVTLTQGYTDGITPSYTTTYKEGKVDPKQLTCILSVKDTGVGITAESIALIFERFFQVKAEGSTHLGSGIGLAIAKSVVMQHNGIIIVSSERAVGTEFIIALPIHHTCSKNKSEENTFNVKTFIESQYVEYESIAKDTQTTSIESINAELPVLLIVEDNIELQNMLSLHFKDLYNIQIANNGQEGLNFCLQHFPDIVISDVMMPEMDGIEMCCELRNNLSTANIPIILLTAKSDVEYQIEGYESGADLYIAKPFSMKLLKVNVARLLKQKEQQLQSHTSPIVEREPMRKQELLDLELQSFEKQIKELIQKNINNPNLTVEFLSAEMNLSRTKLYAMVKESLSESLAEYIRNIRLERASYLLNHSILNITEIMLEVGFVNSSHFSKIFRLKYGVPPSEYSKKEA